MNARIMFIGEAPGATEDELGRPFIGKSGTLLTRMLNEIGLSRNEVFITNIVKCRPPNNRTPRLKEIDSCRKHLLNEIDLVKPDVIVLLGKPANCAVLGRNVSLISEHGTTFKSDKQTYFVMYHPAAALRNKTIKGLMKEDFLKLKGVIGGSEV